MFVKKSLKKKSFLVIGLGRFGSSFAKNMMKMGCEVVAVDEDLEKVNKISEFVTEAMAGNIHDEDFLTSLGLSDFDAVVVAIGHDIESSVLITTLVKELGAKYVVSKAADDLHEKILQKIGADWVVTVEREMGQKVALSLYSNKVIDSLELTPDFRFVELLVLESWLGKKVATVGVFKNHDLMLVAVKRGKEIITKPGEDLVFQKEDLVVVCGQTAKIMQLA